MKVSCAHSSPNPHRPSPKQAALVDTILDRDDTTLFRRSRSRRLVTGLRRQGLDILTAQEDETTVLADDALLRRSTTLGRVLFTQDIRFKALAEDWQRQNIAFAGLLFGHQLHGSVGRYIGDLQLIAQVTDPEDWMEQVEQLTPQIVPLLVPKVLRLPR